MKKRVLVATLGTAPSVITEAIDHLLLRDINLTEVFIITTSDTDGLELNWGNNDAILAFIE